MKRSLETGQAGVSQPIAEVVTGFCKSYYCWRGGLAERASASASRRLDYTPASFALDWRGLPDFVLVLALVAELSDDSGAGGHQGRDSTLIDVQCAYKLVSSRQMARMWSSTREEGQERLGVSGGAEVEARADPVRSVRFTAGTAQHSRGGISSNLGAYSRGSGGPRSDLP